MLLAVLFLAALPAVAQQIAPLLCDATGEPRQIAAEGLSERLGDVVLTCTKLSGDTVSNTLTVLVSAPITNRLSSNGRVDAVLMAQSDTGLITVGGSPLLTSANTLVFNPFTFKLPASGITSFRITNIRVAAHPASVSRPVQVTLSPGGQGNIGIRNNPTVAGIIQRALLTSSIGAQVICLGSPLPEELTFGSLLSATRYVTTRVTEGFPTAFEPKLAGADYGVRIQIRYSGFPASARVFVPIVVAGMNAATPTSPGEFGVPPSGGAHTASTSGSLLLSLVGSAGPLYLPPPPPGPLTEFLGMAEIALHNGAGAAFYEVVESNASAVESAQLVTFVAIPEFSGEAAIASAEVRFAPVSTIAEAQSGVPVPRFRDVEPGLDCTTLGDCRASYFPRLLVDPGPSGLTFLAEAGSTAFFGRHIRILNEGGSLLYWQTSINYRDGSGWLKATPSSGINNASINLTADPRPLGPGIYRANFIVDAGPIAGSRTFPVELTVTAAAQPPPVTPPKPEVQRPRFWQISNAALETEQNLVAGSRAFILGTRLLGQPTRVTMNGAEAVILSANDGRIDFIVPETLALLDTATLLVEAGGVVSDAATVRMAVSAPGIFSGGVFNQDGSVHSVTNAELAGRMIQVFATGLPISRAGLISARIHDREIDMPLYAGPAPGSPGVQQVNLMIPADLPETTTEVTVCGAALSSPATKICSPPAPLTIRR